MKPTLYIVRSRGGHSVIYLYGNLMVQVFDASGEIYTSRTYCSDALADEVNNLLMTNGI